ncbi:MAG: ribosome biogenesis GTPase Der [Desulfonatronovibrio sp.]
MLPYVVIAGRPNVGKSTLFNRLIRKNRAITHDRAGVTRDRLYGVVRYDDQERFALVDTGGLIPDTKDILEKEIFNQASEAIDMADLILLVVDGREGLTRLDEQLADMLRQSNKPVHLVINKVDGREKSHLLASDFFSLGLDMTTVSAAHGHNIPELIEDILARLPDCLDEEKDETYQGLRFSFLGRPNVGKSSLLNTISGENRVMVSSTAGTTRDSVDISLEKNGRFYTFVDTAGVRRRTTIRDDLERFSVLRALKSSKRADIVFLVLDALSGLLAQDRKLLAFLDREKTPFIVLVNKIDLVPRAQQNKLKEMFKNELSYCSHAPVVYTSAITRAGLGGLIPLAEKLWDQCQIRIGTGELNRLVRDATTRHQPPSVKGKRAKIYYMTQAGSNPPEFVFFVNNDELVKPSYRKYLEKQIRKIFKLDMTPVRLVFRASHG